MKAMAFPAVAFIAFQTAAMPAMPRPRLIPDGDGNPTEVLILGDENFHVIASPDGSGLLARDSRGRLKPQGPLDAAALRRQAEAKAGRRQISGSTTFPCYGKQRALAILVEFPSTILHPQGRKFAADDPVALFSDMLNGDAYAADGATGSVHEYFLDSSNGVLDLTFDVAGPVMLSQDVVHYIPNEGVWEMVVEACTGVNDDVDFSEYDRDHDGVIDNVYIFYAGPGAATGGDPADCIWQHASEVELLSGKTFLFDGVRLNHYACSNEYREIRDGAGNAVRLTEGIGTVVHEFGHVLGLPDLYDVYYAGNPSPGIWDVMDTGCHLNESRTPAAYSALDRMLLGWLDPVEIGASPASLSLRDISANGAYRIPSARPDEFFLLENRQNSGWDEFLPGHGMLLWRINYQEDYWNANQVNTGRGVSHAIIIGADGRPGGDSHRGDPFPGSANVRAISDEGYPNMLSSDGRPTNAPLSSINEAGGLITFDICRAVTSLGKVSGVVIAELSPSSCRIEWEPVPLAAGYVARLLGEDDAILRELDGITSCSFTFTGLEPQARYTVAMAARAGSVMGDFSDPLPFVTPAMSFEYETPAPPQAEVIDPYSFHAGWEPLPEAADYALLLSIPGFGEDLSSSLDFTGGLDAIPSGWSTNALSTLSMSGYYGESSPALALSDFGRLQSPVLDSPITGFSFWYRERTPSGTGSIHIEVLDGEGTWKEIDSFSLPEPMAAGMRYDLPAELIPDMAMAVRIIYHREDKGTLALDDVTLSVRGQSIETPLQGWDPKLAGSDKCSALIDGLQPETTYYFRVRGIDARGRMSKASPPAVVTTSRTDAMQSPDCDVDAPALIFDLWGRRVDASALKPGIYIMRKNNNSYKIIR